MPKRKLGVFWIKLAAYLCGMSMLCNVAGWLMEGGVDTSRNAMALRHLPRNSVDVLWLGSSHTYCGIIPQKLYDDYGVTSAMLTMSNFTVRQMYWGLQETLRQQNPQVIVMELFTATTPYGYGAALNALWTRRPELIAPDTMVFHQAAQTARWLPIGSPYKPFAIGEARRDSALDLTEMLALTKMHYRYAELSRADFTILRGQNQLSMDFGAEYRVNTMDAAKVEKLPYTPEDAVSLDSFWLFDSQQLEEVELQADVRQDLERIIRLTRERGIELVFCVTPYMANAAEEKVYAQLEQIALEEGIPYVGMADSGVTDLRYLSDIGHLNAEGALRNTDFWGRYLTAHYPLEDRRQSGMARYAPWREREGRYKAQIAVRSAATDQLDGYLEMLAQLDGDFLVLVGMRGEADALLTAEEERTLAQALNIPPAVLEEWHAAGAGTLNLLVHNKRLLSSACRAEGSDSPLLWNALGNAVEIDGGLQNVNFQPMLSHSGEGVCISVFSMSDNSCVSKAIFPPRGAGE